MYPDVISLRPFLMSNTDDNGVLNDDHQLDESLEEGDFLNDSGESEDKNMLALSDPGTVNVYTCIKKVLANDQSGLFFWATEFWRSIVQLFFILLRKEWGGGGGGKDVVG